MIMLFIKHGPRKKKILIRNHIHNPHSYCCYVEIIHKYIKLKVMCSFYGYAFKTVCTA